MINWMDRKYVNPRKRVFKNMQTDEILNLEIQEDLQNIETESETPLNAEMLNLAQQEVLNEIEKRINNINVSKSTYIVKNQILGNTEIEIPIYYKVGFETLDVIYNGKMLRKATSSDEEGEYYEIGEEGSISNKIKITSNWSANIGDWFAFKAKGSYEVAMEVKYLSKSTNIKEEIPNSRDGGIMYFNSDDLQENELAIFCDIKDIKVIITKDGSELTWDNGMKLTNGTYVIEVQRYNGSCKKSFIIDTTIPTITGVKDGGQYTKARTITLDLIDLKIATLTIKGEQEQVIDLKELNFDTYTIENSGKYIVYVEDHYGNSNVASFEIRIR